VIIDLPGVPYMDSAGLGVLLVQSSHGQLAGLENALVGLSPWLLTMFEITRTD
jgi:anti-anti-sigma factor